MTAWQEAESAHLCRQGASFRLNVGIELDDAVLQADGSLSDVQELVGSGDKVLLACQ